MISFQQCVRKDKQAPEEKKESQRHFFLTLLWYQGQALYPSWVASSLWDVGKGTWREEKQQHTKSQKGPEEDGNSVRASILLGP